jgi:hypothetical protein
MSLQRCLRYVFTRYTLSVVNSLNRVTSTHDANPESSIVTTRWYAAGENKREAMALRHNGYVAAKLIEPSPWGIYVDPYDELQTTVTAGLFRRGACTATLRISYYAPGAQGSVLPCEKVYPEVAAVKASATGPVVELSRLSIDPTIDNTRYRARLYAAAIRSGLMACIALDAKHLLVATQTKWRSFYEHVLGFEVAAPAQFYPPGNVPVILLARELDDAVLKRIANNMFFKTDEAEIDDLRALLPTLIGSQNAQF